MTSTERDLATQAEQFLQEIFEDKISETEKLALENWLSTQLEQERQGWKKKLQMSMKEIEKERKQALDVHLTLHEFNSKLESDPRLETVLKKPEYCGSDNDLKVTHIQQLERHIDDIMTSLRNLQKEHTECLHHLDVNADPDGISLLGLIQQKMNNTDMNIKVLVQESKETEERLLKEIHALNETLELQQSLNRREKEKMETKNLELQRVIFDLREQVPQLTVETDNKAIQVQTLKMSSTLDKSTQVEIDENDITKSSSQLHDPDISNNDMLSPITLVQISKHAKSSNSDNNNDSHNIPVSRVLSFDHQVTGSGHINALHKDMEYNVHRYFKHLDTKNLDQTNTIDYLRDQVITFSQRLEQAKLQTDLYQRQLAWIKSGHPEDKTSHKHPKENAHAKDFKADCPEPMRRWSSEGFLGGVKKEIKNSKERFGGDSVAVYSQFKRKADVKHPNPMSTAKCLRCQKLYRVRDNQKMVCRHHPKSKQKIEKYDSNGKLVKVVYLWECCMQKPEALGCTMGEHV